MVVSVGAAGGQPEVRVLYNTRKQGSAVNTSGRAAPPGVGMRAKELPERATMLPISARAAAEAPPLPTTKLRSPPRASASSRSSRCSRCASACACACWKTLKVSRGWPGGSGTGATGPEPGTAASPPPSYSAGPPRGRKSMPLLEAPRRCRCRATVASAATSAAPPGPRPAPLPPGPGELVPPGAGPPGADWRGARCEELELVREVMRSAPGEPAEACAPAVPPPPAAMAAAALRAEATSWSETPCARRAEAVARGRGAEMGVEGDWLVGDRGRVTPDLFEFFAGELGHGAPHSAL
ncbi:hypothetical protein TSOC_004984 [Tetrabaena socialis]|uniref:Uncharacterized protein n=1 Tax=Tetrabaena socialis TaxID=47790 RepID=A0A2J8A7H4_9CHLO|nr:hypothetical protein TSOC_004984 [Tetrabaena socialis]|eukprot:PNH08455.1 hypothetical protein TSOC_004984 [Tetrabaena socialis]